MENEQTDLNEQYEEIKGGQVDEFWKPVMVGAQISGTLIGSFDSTFGKCYMLDCRGHTFGLPSHTTLLTKLMKVSEGSNVRITYEGEQPNKQNQPFKTYKVEVAKSA